MAGHNKWSSIKHKKGALDLKRGKIFSKIAKEIMTAVRLNGSDIDTNIRLRAAISEAKNQNMTNDNIQRAVKKGSGDSGAQEQIQELFYEGYGPEKVAILVECLTDNRNRSASEVRTVFNKSNGSLGTPGSVSWMFDKKSVFTIDTILSEDKLFELAFSAEAEDISYEKDNIEIIANVDKFNAVYTALEKHADIEIKSAKIAFIAKDIINIDEIKKAKRIISMLNNLDSLDDVQEVYCNIKIQKNILEQLS